MFEFKFKKITSTQFAKKWLLGFFSIMLLLTIISRIVDSLTVPFVTTTNWKRDALSFTIEGNGTIYSNTEMYLELVEQVHIEKLNSQCGTKVKKGDPLFTYSKTDIQAKYDEKSEELKKAQLELEKLRLSNEKQQVTSDIDDDLQNAKKRAELDLKAAQLEIENTQKSYDKAVTKANEKAEKLAENDINNKQKEYETARKNYEEVELTNSEAILTAQRAVADAKDKLANSLTKDGDLYDKYKLEISKAEEDVTRAKNALTLVKANWERTMKELIEKINALDPSDPAYATAKENYEEKFVEKETEISQYDEALSSATNTLNILKKQYPEYTEGATRKALTYAEEDLKHTIEKCDKTLTEAKKTLDNASEELKKAGKEPFDYDTELSGALQAINSAKKSAETADRVLEDTNYELEKSIKAKAIEANNLRIQNEMDALDVEILDMNIKNLQKEANKLKNIINNDGIVTAPADGTLVKLTLEEGKYADGAIVSIGIDKCCFKAVISKEDAKHLSVKDEINIKASPETQNEQLVIDAISSADKDGSVEITAILTSEDYAVGTEATFKVLKKSETYDMCVPIQAIRQGLNSKYILICSEKNTTLGMRVVAERINIEVLDKNALTAAIRGTINKKDKIIISSNRNIEEGDRIRIDSDE